LFFDYWRQHRLEIKVARIFNTYGPRMHPNDGRVVSNFIVQALLGRDITVYGDGSQTRSFCYVDDLIEGLIRLTATSAEVTGPVNLGNPVEFSVLELARMVIDLTASHSRIVHRPRPEDDPKQRRPDISRAEELLDWKPRTMLKDGLVNTIAYFDRLPEAACATHYVASLTKCIPGCGDLPQAELRQASFPPLKGTKARDAANETNHRR
jgi:UDP-glucuronate decarboxylase